MILGGFFFLMVLTFFRETNRSIVGDGSVPPQKWNRSLVQIFRKDKLVANPESLAEKRIGVNPLASIQILRNKENFIVCIYGALLFGGYASVISIFATQLEERYGYSQVQVGLCYLPFGVGSILSRWTAGKMIDWNFKREADKQGMFIFRVIDPRHLSRVILTIVRLQDCQESSTRFIPIRHRENTSHRVVSNDICHLRVRCCLRMADAVQYACGFGGGRCIPYRQCLHRCSDRKLSLAQRPQPRKRSRPRCSHEFDPLLDGRWWSGSRHAAYQQDRHRIHGNCDCGCMGRNSASIIPGLQ